MLDLLIRDGTVYTGDEPPRRADVAIEHGLVHDVGDVAADTPARETVDAAGRIVCPGFIDLHAHSALRPFTDPSQAPKLGQGFTTELVGLDGLGPAPVRPECVAERRAYLNGLEGPSPDSWNWCSFDEYLAALEEAGPATNLVACVGHNTVREHVIGTARRDPERAELAAMRREVSLALEAGARALSFGLVYLPGMFAGTDELVALAEEAGAAGAPLIPHVRNESTQVLRSHAEFVDVAKRSGAPLHLSHLKVVGGDPVTVDRLLAQIDAARAEIPLTFDQYPYGAGSTLLGSLLPPWAHEGGPTRLLDRLHDASERARMRESMESDLGWENIYSAVGPERIVLADAGTARADDVGSSFEEIAQERGTDAITAVLDVLVDTELAATRIDHYAGEDVVRTIFRHPAMTVGSDGVFAARPHPRLYGTAPRILGRYAHRDGLISPQEAIARMTSRPADILGLGDRGRLAPGLRADVVVLDLDAYIDAGTFAEPVAYPEGVVAVLVGGRFAWRDGAPTGARCGTVVRSPREA